MPSSSIHFIQMAQQTRDIFNQIWLLSSSVKMVKPTSTTFAAHGFTFARLAMSYGFVGVAIISFFAVVTVSSGRIVSAFETHSAADPSGQLEQFHVEATASCVQVTVAGCK